MDKQQKYKIIKQLPESLINGDVLSSISSERRSLFFALLLEDNKLEKGHICTFNDGYIARVQCDGIKMDDGYMYAFQPLSFNKFDYNVHVGDNCELKCTYINYGTTENI